MSIINPLRRIFGSDQPRPMHEIPRPYDMQQQPTFQSNAPMDLELPGRTTVQQPQPQVLQGVEEYTPEHAGMDRMKQMIANMPVRQEPGRLRSIFGAIAQGLGGGPEANERIRYAPYNRQMADWESQIKPVEDLANMERYSNANERQRVTSQNQYDLNVRKQEEAERKNAATEDLNREKLEVTKVRAAAYDWKARHPNHEFKEDSTGHIIALDPQTNEAKIVTDENGEPIKSGKLSDAEKFNLGIKKLDKQLENALKLEGVRQGNRMALTDRQSANRISARKAVLDKEKLLSASQDTAAYKLAQKQFIMDNPAYSKFFTDSGEPIPSAAEDDDYIDAVEDIRRRYNEIKARAVGQSPTTTPTGSLTPNLNPALPPPDQRPEGMKYSFPDGRKVKWSKASKGWVEDK